ncbi:MAG TPA: sigma-54 dependent transcriptional regulator [Cyclobacteriaceae bacterium]|nr:sigma-54 dependent transcriptional regulator [Cyclobacteriaceae bacterium]
MQRILVIDDDRDICTLLSRFLEKNGYEVDAVCKGDDAIKLLREKPYALTLCDYRLPDTNGIEMLQRIKVLQPDVAVIVITGYSDVRTAVQTFKFGASDYIVKPLFPDEILVTIKEAIEKNSARKNVTTNNSERKIKQSPGHDFIIGKSPQSETVQRHINLVAPSNMSVIIFGETGTGKEYVARSIHEKSSRADKPFVAIDCGALPKELAGSELFGHSRGSFTGAIADKVGSFEVANSGTLFLDEIGNLSYENQVKLLRVLQESKIRRIGSTNDIAIDVRIITATNEDLVKAVKEGRFREDLYHRLNEFKIELSPLRERKDDIEIFALHFLEKANESLGKNIKAISPNAMDRITRYYWHGNLRELNNVIKRAVLLSQGDEVMLENLPQEIIEGSSVINGANDGSGELGNYDFLQTRNFLKSVSGIAERQAILDVLEKTGFNKTRAAELLNIDRKTLYNKLKAYDIRL